MAKIGKTYLTTLRAAFRKSGRVGKQHPISFSNVRPSWIKNYRKTTLGEYHIKYSDSRGSVSKKFLREYGLKEAFENQFVGVKRNAAGQIYETTKYRPFGTINSFTNLQRARARVKTSLGVGIGANLEFASGKLKKSFSLKGHRFSTDKYLNLKKQLAREQRLYYNLKATAKKLGQRARFKKPQLVLNKKGKLVITSKIKDAYKKATGQALARGSTHKSLIAFAQLEAEKREIKDLAREGRYNETAEKYSEYFEKYEKNKRARKRAVRKRVIRIT